MKKLIVFGLAGAMLYSCNSNQTPPASSETEVQTDQNQLVIENDMENAAAMLPSWINEVTVVKMDKVKAHSGEFASKVDDVNVYSYTFRETFENINEKLPKRIVVNGWYYLAEENKKLGLTMDINESGKTYIWQAYNFSNDNPVLNQWNEFTAYFTIDKPITPAHQLKIFGFGDKKVAYFDDIKIIFEY